MIFSKLLKTRISLDLNCFVKNKINNNTMKPFQYEIILYLEKYFNLIHKV